MGVGLGVCEYIQRESQNIFPFTEEEKFHSSEERYDVNILQNDNFYYGLLRLFVHKSTCDLYPYINNNNKKN